MTLARLDCPVTLDQRDFVAALDDRSETTDVAWIGQSLHHPPTASKLAVMRNVGGILGERGQLLIWEPTLAEGEDFAGWLHRFETWSRPAWTALMPEEWEAMAAHIRAADLPETASGWQSLSLEAGFRDARELYVAPTNLNRMYCFRARAVTLQVRPAADDCLEA